MEFYFAKFAIAKSLLFSPLCANLLTTTQKWEKITAGSHCDSSQATLDLSANNSLAMSYPCKHEKITKDIHKKTREYHEKTTPQKIFVNVSYM